MNERLQIRLAAWPTLGSAEVRTSSGFILPVKRVEMKYYDSSLCAVLTLDSEGFEVCTLHGRRCYLPDPEFIAVENSDLAPGYARVLMQLTDLQSIATMNFRIGGNNGKEGDWRNGAHGEAKTELPEIIVCQFALRRDREPRDGIELDVWVAPESYELKFTNK